MSDQSRILAWKQRKTAFSSVPHGKTTTRKNSLSIWYYSTRILEHFKLSLIGWPIRFLFAKQRRLGECSITPKTRNRADHEFQAKIRSWLHMSQRPVARIAWNSDWVWINHRSRRNRNSGFLSCREKSDSEKITRNENIDVTTQNRGQNSDARSGLHALKKCKTIGGWSVSARFWPNPNRFYWRSNFPVSIFQNFFIWGKLQNSCHQLE